MSDDHLRSVTPLTASQLGYNMSRSMPPLSTTGRRGSSESSYNIGGNASSRNISPAITDNGHGIPGTGFTALPPVSAAPPPQDSDQSSGSDLASADGRQFFRAAKSKLSQDGFNKFLASIKRLNSGEQTREDTLEDVSVLFGPENQELFHGFENLLNSH